MDPSKRIDIESPRFDQNTFEGRWAYFRSTVNPLNVLASEQDLKDAKHIIDSYRNKTEDPSLTEDQLWKAKDLYDSQTGELMFLPGRMSFQVPGNMITMGAMLTFYKTVPAVVFWQFANQTFNAGVNYTNRNASAKVTEAQLGAAYAAASIASVSTAIGFNKIVARSPKLSAGIIGSFVPLVAVAAANCVNIPLMRQQEVKDGIMIQTNAGEDVGLSGNAAVSAISQVIPSRIIMSAAAMLTVPVLMKPIEKTTTLIKNPWLKAPCMVLLSGLMLSISTPFCCALFPQRAEIPLTKLEPNLQELARSKFPGHTSFFFNKGL